MKKNKNFMVEYNYLKTNDFRNYVYYCELLFLRKNTEENFQFYKNKHNYYICRIRDYWPTFPYIRCQICLYMRKVDNGLLKSNNHIKVKDIKCKKCVKSKFFIRKFQILPFDLLIKYN
jgi:hypothetical protein